MEPGAGGNARVMVAIEIDLAGLAVEGGQKRAARLDLTVMGTSAWTWNSTPGTRAGGSPSPAR
jgi:hypothetical protein